MTERPKDAHDTMTREEFVEAYPSADAEAWLREHDAVVRRNGINDACAALERVAMQYESPDTPWYEHPVLLAVRREIAALAEPPQEKP